MENKTFKLTRRMYYGISSPFIDGRRVIGFSTIDGEDVKCNMKLIRPIIIASCQLIDYILVRTNEEGEWYRKVVIGKLVGTFQNREVCFETYLKLL